MCTRIYSAAVLALILTGCGGGGGSDDTSVSANPPAPAPAAAGLAPAPAPAPVGSPSALKSCEAFPSASGGVVNGSLAGKASSPAGRSLTFSLLTLPSSGTVSLSPAGAFSYTPSSPSRGNLDSFTYRVTDSAGLTAEATAQVVYGSRRIMPLGDSITEGVETFNSTTGDLPASPFRVGYRKPLHALLTEAGYAIDFVGSRTSGSAAGLLDDEHEGYSGAGQVDLLTGMNTRLNQNPPDVILLHIGTNDVPGDTSAGPTSNLLNEINSWTRVATNPPVRLLLSTIIKQRSGTPEVEAFNANLTTMYNQSWVGSSAARSQFDVRMIDMHAKLNNTSDLSDPSSDSVGLHPNATGYSKMAAAWFQSLVETGAVQKCP